MAPELSSNWKKLQAAIKAESTNAETKKETTTGIKRKAAEIGSAEARKSYVKKQKVEPSRSTEKSKRPIARTANGKVVKPEQGKKRRMGSAQSKITEEPKGGVAPSLALWAEDTDISPEDVAEAYGLGAKGNSMLSSLSSRPNEGPAKGVEVGKYIAIDCEMVGVGEGGYESVLARVSVVDFHGRQVYDSFVRPQERVTDWRTHVSGVGPRDMAAARTFTEVQAAMAELFKGRILVGHDIRHDLEVLMLEHPKKMIRDTARFSGFKKYGNGPKPALRNLSREILGVEIQTGQHSSIEDARVAMLLFRRFKQAFDVEHANRFPDVPAGSASPRPKNLKGKKKRKN